jgi:hypothetical protein
MAVQSTNRWMRILIVAVAVVVGAGIVFGLYVASVSLDAERTHQADLLVLASLTDFVRETGRWPKDWNELATVTPSGEGMDRLHSDLAEIRRRVYVDFSVTAADVGAMDVDGFSVVKQLGPNYGPNERQVRKLIEAARRHSKTEDQDR